MQDPVHTPSHAGEPGARRRRTHALTALLARHERRPARRQRDRLVRRALVARAALAAHKHAAIGAVAARRAAEHAGRGLQRALQRRDDDHLRARQAGCPPKPKHRYHGGCRVRRLQGGARLHVEGQRKARHVAPERRGLLPAPARQVRIVILLPADVVEALCVADEVDGLRTSRPCSARRQHKARESEQCRTLKRESIRVSGAGLLPAELHLCELVGHH